MTARATLTPLSPAEAKALVDSGKAVLVDIREADEHAREAIAGATLAPLSRFGADSIAPAGDKGVIFLCQSGMRTATHARRLAGACKGEAYVLAGGLNAWRAAGLPLA